MRSKNDVECIADVAKNVREKIIIETKKNDSFQRKEKKSIHDRSRFYAINLGLKFKEG